MNGETKIKVKLEVEVDIGYIIDPRSMEASIISARIDPIDNPITPRMVNAAMNHGQYGMLDQTALADARRVFRERCEKYMSAAIPDLPSEEIRSVPMTATLWKDSMVAIRGKSMRMPYSVIVDHALRMSALVEPVLCRTPTLYLWPHGLSNRLDGVEEIKMSIKASVIKEMEDGSWKVTWK